LCLQATFSMSDGYRYYFMVCVHCRALLVALLARLLSCQYVVKRKAIIGGYILVFEWSIEYVYPSKLIGIERIELMVYPSRLVGF
jgi:hypothetical protein